MADKTENAGWADFVDCDVLAEAIPNRCPLQKGGGNAFQHIQRIPNFLDSLEPMVEANKKMSLARTLIIGLLASAILVLAPPISVQAQESTGTSGTSDLEQRLEATEQRLQELESFRYQATRSMNSNQGSDDSLSIDHIENVVSEVLKSKSEDDAGSNPTVNVFGRMHLETLGFIDDSPGIGFFENPASGNDPDNRIQFRRIRLGAQGEIMVNGIYRVELDFGNPSRTTFRDTYIGFTNLPVFQTLLIGNQKRPLGLDSWNSNQHVLFLERPLAVNAFNPSSRRVGIQSYGHTEDQRLNWQMGVFELPDNKAIGRDVGDSLQFSYNVRVSGTPWYDDTSGGRGYLHLGVSNMIADTNANPGLSDQNGNQAFFGVRPELRTSSQWIDTGTIAGGNHFNVTGLESVLNVGSLQVTGEYLTTTVGRENNSNVSFNGGYAQAAYVLTGEHEPWHRTTGRIGRLKPFENFFLVNRANGTVGSGWGAWQIAARWSYLNLTDADIRGGREENVTLGLNWYWTPYSKVVLNVVNGQISDRSPVGGFTGGHFTGVGLRFLMDF